jgi:hypothetical protein
MRAVELIGPNNNLFYLVVLKLSRSDMTHVLTQIALNGARKNKILNAFS